MISRFTFCFLLIVFCGCQSSENYVPKPRVYPKIDFPEKEERSFDESDCPFTMSVPQYFAFSKDEAESGPYTNSDCWFDLHCAPLNSYYYFSYISLRSGQLDELVEDAFEMADKHNVKANYRDEVKISNKEKKVYGLLFEINGPVAAPLQFYLTDSTEHFLRGSLYFNAKVNRDSLAPVYNFMKEDFNKMVETFQWK